MAYRNFAKVNVPQSEPLPDTAQVKNSAGGFTWEVDQWTRLHRFLILGSEGGTYYVNEQSLTKENADSVLDCIKADGIRVVSEVVKVSTEGLAPKQDPGIFVLALCAAYGDTSTRQAALSHLSDVCRTGSTLFQFLETIKGMKGWGRGMKRAVGAWYTAKEPRQLAYQVIKYRQRYGWTHRDTLRKSHPNSASHRPLFDWITHGHTPGGDDETAHYIQGYEQLQSETDVHKVAELILKYRFPREAVSTQWLTEIKVWEALLEDMPMTAMVRNLGVMSSIGLLKPMANTWNVVNKLRDPEVIKKSRLHPITLLSALRVYQQGHGDRGSKAWVPVPQIVDALEDAFYLAFDNVEPSNKRTMLALDVSSSMGWNSCAGVQGITPREGSVAMALVTARAESKYFITAFSHQMVEVPITARMRLQDAHNTISRLGFGDTDCSLPMLYAAKNNLDVDTFVIYTDSETWAGSVHPSIALRDYRQKSGIPARLVVVAMKGNRFSIADPNDSGMMDVVGFDTSAPKLIRDFSAGLV